MSSKIKIYFIGRKQGIGHRKWRLSHLENRRKDEPQGLIDASRKIEQIRFISRANVIWVRIRPEFTTDVEVNKIKERLKKEREEKIIINDIDSFYNYDSKNITFQLWKKAGLECPNYISISPRKLEKDQSRIVTLIQEFISIHDKIFLRTNNETAAKGIFVLDSNCTQKDILDKLLFLKNRCLSFKSNRMGTNILSVEFIKPENKSGFIDLYRAHILFGKIISYYVVTSKLDVFHNKDMCMDDLERFITLNQEIPNIIERFKEQILLGASSLGCNIGAIEFFIRDGKPIFLEFNPMWGGQASKTGFGSDEVQGLLSKQKSNLVKKIPNIYSFLDYRNYYQNLYEKIYDNVSRTLTD